MKQKLLFLMAFMLLGVTMVKAQTIIASDIAAVYGDPNGTLTPSLSTPDASVKYTFTTSNSDVVNVNTASGQTSTPLTFGISGTAEITITPSLGTIQAKKIIVTVAQKALKVVVNTGAVVSKVYNGIPAAEIDESKFTLDGIKSGDNGSVLPDFTGVTATFNPDYEVGTNLKVILNKGLGLKGPKKDNYKITENNPPTDLKGTITQADQPVRFGMDQTNTVRLADGTFTPTVDVKGGAYLNGIIQSGGSEFISLAIDASNRVTITAKKEGSATVKFFTADTKNYKPLECTITFNVTGPTEDNVISNVENSYSYVYGSANKLSPSVKGGAPVTYESSDETTLRVDANGNITTVKVGTATVNIKVGATLVYKTIEKPVAITITQKDLNITGVKVKNKVYDGTKDAELDWSTASLTGIVSGDANMVAYDNTGVSVEFVNANVGTRDVSVTGNFSLKAGSSSTDKSGNYKPGNTLTGLALQGVISKANQVANLGLPTTAEVFVNRSYSLDLTLVKGNVSYTYTAPNATVNSGDNSVTYATAGTYTLRVKAVDANANYNDMEATIVFTVRANNAIVFSGTTAFSGEYGDKNVSCPIEASWSGGGVAGADITYASSAPTIVSIDASTGKMEYKNVGSATITVTVKASANYAAATSPAVSVTSKQRTLTLNGLGIKTKTYDGNTAAEVNSWTGVTLGNTIPSSSDDVSINNNPWPTVTFKDKNAGPPAKDIVVNTSNALIGADRAKYTLAATGVTGIISKANQATNLNLPASKSLKFGEPYTVTPSILESNNYTVTYSSDATDIATVSTNGVITYKKTGSARISVTLENKAGAEYNHNYNIPSVVPSTLLIIDRGTQVITIPNSTNYTISKLLSDGSFSLSPQGLGNPSFTFETVNDPDHVLSVSPAGVVTLNKAGTGSILVTALQNTLYEEAKQVVTINVNQGVSITVQPQPVSICDGGSFTLSVGATGATSYQWKRAGVAIPGATGSSYTVSNAKAVDHGGSYTVTVTGVNGSTVTSNPVTVTIGSPVIINTQPASQNVCQGASRVEFSVAASGGELSYQWYKDGNVINHTLSTYAINNVEPSHAGVYKVEVTGNGACGSGTVTSANATLTVTPALPAEPSFYSVPSYLVKKHDDITVIVADANNNPYPNVTKYIWNYSTTGTTFAANETTTNSNVLRVTPSSQDGTLTVDLQHVCGNKRASKVLKAVSTGIDNVTDAGMRVYPNPVKAGEAMTIDLGDGNTSATIYVYNVTGSLLMNANLTAQKSTMPTTLKSGIYMMKIVTPNGKTAHHKFIVK